ncbi:CAP domain-containing protein [Amylibacter sp.]|nr:CAP domain-containing protein [Amylibacter sp.]MDC0489367.1 CAP domain-containing protein [Amylibacter sp.]
MWKVLSTTALLIVLAACETPSVKNRPGDGTVIILMGRIGVDKVQFRHLDSVNAVRQARGLSALSLDTSLIRAAKSHASDMSAQNRPWHFGSDGSSPLDRLVTYGYNGEFIGENVSETFEDDFNTLDVWMNVPLSASIILDPKATKMGIAWHQDTNGKIWWVQLIAS